jgi:hypothetical protein
MKHRRRVFALPFVMILGCGGAKTAPPTTTTTTPTSPTQSEKLSPPPEGTPTKGTGPAGQAMWTYPNGDVVYAGDDGTCHAQYKEHCAQDPEAGPTHCNPPPPQQVRCPDDAK